MSGCRVNRVLFIWANISLGQLRPALSRCRGTIYRAPTGGASPAPTEDLALAESRQDIIRVARVTRKPRRQHCVRLWTARCNWAIIALWKPAAHSAGLR